MYDALLPNSFFQLNKNLTHSQLQLFSAFFKQRLINHIKYQIFHYTCCNTLNRVTSFRGPSPRHCARATQLLSKKCRSGGEPLATLCLNKSSSYSPFLCRSVAWPKTLRNCAGVRWLDYTNMVQYRRDDGKIVPELAGQKIDPQAHAADIKN